MSFFRRTFGGTGAAPATPTFSRPTEKEKLERDVRRFTLALEQCDKARKPGRYAELERELKLRTQLLNIHNARQQGDI